MNARDRLREALAAVEASTDEPARLPHSRAAAHAAGELAFAGEPRTYANLDERTLRTVRVDVATLALDDLADATRPLRALSHGFRRSDAPLVEYLRKLLVRRTEVELIGRGLSALLGHTFEWSGSQRESVRAFDDAAEEVLFHLVAINDVRAELLDPIAPQLRDELWWLSRGVELPAAAIEHLADVAALVAQFPTARALFDDRVRATEQHLRARPGGSTRRISRGFSLDAWLADHDGEERVYITRSARHELAVEPPELLTLRVRSVLRNTERPHLRTANAEHAMEPVPGSRTHFELRLDPRVRLASSLSLVIPFADRDEVIDILCTLEGGARR